MEYSDHGFERFQESLKPFAQSDPLLWRLRDSLYSALAYRMIGFQPEKRHAAGIWSWTSWAATELLKSRSPAGIAAPTPFSFLFYGSHGAHFETLLPVLREVASSDKVTAWCLALEESQIHELSSIKNTQVLSVPDALRQVSRADHTANTVTAVKSSFRLSRIAPEHKAEIGRARSLVAQTVLDYLLWRQFWSRIPLSRDSAVFVTSESSPIAKGYLEAALNTGARAIHFCHGLRHSTHQVTNATDFCPFSEVDRRWFAERVGPNTTVHAIGNPRVEQMREAVPPTRRREPGQPFRLLFLNCGVEDPYTQEMLQQDCGILGSDLVTSAKYILRLRPHPRESAETLRRAFERWNVRVDELSRGSLAEDIGWCDAAATQCSTALLEAAVTGRACYWINARADGLCGTGELQSVGLGQLITTAEDWMNATNDMCTLRTAAPAVVTDDLLRRLKILPAQHGSWLSALGFARVTQPDSTR